MKLTSLFIISGTFLLVTACHPVGSTNGSFPAAGSPVAVSAAVIQTKATQEQLAALNLPILSSSWAESNWGKPFASELLADGGYRLIYRKRNSLNYLMIEGSPAAKPNPNIPPVWIQHTDTPAADGSFSIRHNQEWRIANILGQNVRWYKANDGGDSGEFPGYQSVFFRATSPGGGTGWYRIQVNTVSETSAAQWIGQVNWAAYSDAPRQLEQQALPVSNIPEFNDVADPTPDYPLPGYN